MLNMESTQHGVCSTWSLLNMESAQHDLDLCSTRSPLNMESNQDDVYLCNRIPAQALTRSARVKKKNVLLLLGGPITPKISQTPAWDCEVVVEPSHRPAGARHLVSSPYGRDVSSWETLFPTVSSYISRQQRPIIIYNERLR